MALPTETPAEVIPVHSLNKKAGNVPEVASAEKERIPYLRPQTAATRATTGREGNKGKLY